MVLMPLNIQKIPIKIRILVMSILLALSLLKIRELFLLLPFLLMFLLMLLLLLAQNFPFRKKLSDHLLELIESNIIQFLLIQNLPRSKVCQY
jgi:hypothetical protein